MPGDHDALRENAGSPLGEHCWAAVDQCCLNAESLLGAHYQTVKPRTVEWSNYVPGHTVYESELCARG